MLKITTHTLGKTIIVDCCGRIVLDEDTMALRDLVKDLLKESPQIVLNLTEVTCIDSNGIGMLFGLLISGARAGGAIKLAGLVDGVKSVVDMSRLPMTFEVYSTVEEATAYEPEWRLNLSVA